MEEEGHFEIKLIPIKIPKNKILKWLFLNVYWKVWNCWRPRLKSKFYWWVIKIAKYIEEKAKNNE